MIGCPETSVTNNQHCSTFQQREGRIYRDATVRNNQFIFIYVFIYLNVKFIHSSVDQIKKNEMGRARGTYGRGERCVQCFDGDT